MRTFRAVLLVSLSAMVASAQARISTSRTDTNIVVYRSGTLSPAELKGLVAELNMLQLRQRSLEAQLERLRSNDGAPQRIEEVQRQLEQTMVQFFPRQSALTLVCQSVLSSEARAEGYLGLTFDEEVIVSESRAGASELAVRFTGAPRIVAVEPGSPAFRAGVRVGDEWVALGGRRLDGATVQDLDALLRPGLTHALRVRRDGRERELEVVVGKREAFPSSECAQVSGRVMLAPMIERAMADGLREAAVSLRNDPAFATRAPTPPASPRPSTFSFISSTPTVYGASLRALDADAREFIGYTGEGVLVDRVVEGTQAEKAGLKAFDVIVRVNGVVLSSPQSVTRAIQEGRRVELTVQRKGTTRTVVLER
jgi:membrane-associated protease RseP (regulator of RpoE activity)